MVIAQRVVDEIDEEIKRRVRREVLRIGIVSLLEFACVDRDHDIDLEPLKQLHYELGIIIAGAEDGTK